MKKNAIKLNEGALRQIITESVKKVLSEKSVFPHVQGTLYDSGDEKLQANWCVRDLEEGIDFMKQFIDSEMADKQLLEYAADMIHKGYEKMENLMKLASR